MRRARDLAEGAASGDPFQLWHSRLCLRYLVENGLLDQREDARARAAQLLPRLFPPATPAPELDQLLATLPGAVFRTEDSLGWAYQFWQARQREQINDSGSKIEAAQLPAVTQLFTEDYMALSLLHNSLGAWWANRVLARDGQHRSEAAWRDLCTVDGYRFDYLRLLPDGRPAAGGFPGWPGTARELRLLDPCLGSGHLLVLALPILASFRRVEEGLSQAEALLAVLRDNLHGLELEPRCCELAVFNLALAVWRRVGWQPLPALQLACCGLAPLRPRGQWLALAGGSRRLRAAMDRLHGLFQRAPLLGSLLNPRRAAKGSPELLRLLDRAVQAVPTDPAVRADQAVPADPAVRADQAVPAVPAVRADQAVPAVRAELAILADPGSGLGAGGAEMALALLSASFTLVLSNVPYLARGRQCPELATYCDNHHPLAKGDLASVFLDRMLAMAAPGGTVQAVLPQNWLFLKGHQQQRQALLTGQRWLLLARLGPRAFASVSGAVVNVALFTLSLDHPEPGQVFQTLDASQGESLEAKAAALAQGPLLAIPQLAQLRHPDARILLDQAPGAERLSALAQGVHGFGSKDSPRFFRNFWELPGLTPEWQLMQTTVQATTPFGGNQLIVRWEHGAGLLGELGRKALAMPCGRLAWGRKGVSVAQMGGLAATLHLGAIFDKNVAVILPEDPAQLPAIWCFCASPEFFEAVRAVDPSLKVTNRTLVKIPFELARWRREAELRYPDGLPAPHSPDPSQWLFHGHPAGSRRPLHVALARLLGYRWPAESDPALELSADSRAWIRRCPELGRWLAPGGILPLAQAADQLRGLLGAAFGPDWSAAKEAALLEAEGFAGQGLEDWLRQGFAEQHNQLFHQRPFLWLLGDPHPQGFGVLVNYHQLDRPALEGLIRTQLGAWIRGPGQAPGARLERALELRTRLRAILRGEPPWDLFVRWKPLAQQPMGWEPDLGDGVRVNIRPFVAAGVLAREPRIHWRKDRGLDSGAVPRFLPLQGERANDWHLTLADKARGRACAPTAGPPGPAG